MSITQPTHVKCIHSRKFISSIGQLNEPTQKANNKETQGTCLLSRKCALKGDGPRLNMKRHTVHPGPCNCDANTGGIITRDELNRGERTFFFNIVWNYTLLIFIVAFVNVAEQTRQITVKRYIVQYGRNVSVDGSPIRRNLYRVGSIRLTYQQSQVEHVFKTVVT